MASAPREVWGDLATTAFVEASHLFKSLDPDARRDLLQVAQRVTFSAGELVCGSDEDGFCLVVDGAAVLHVAGPGGAVELAGLDRGAFFGASRVLGGAAHAFSLAARTEVTVVRFPSAVLAVLAERFPRMKRLLEAVLGAREKDAFALVGG